MRELRRLCVFCGSSSGHDPGYASAAAEVGAELARRGIGVVYGGGSVGLMGQVATAAMAAGGEVVGIIPDFLDRVELAKRDITRLEVTSSMHERKARMAELSDGFVALPGGLGTFEEVFEAMTWTQLGVHDKPVGLVDVNGYWAPAAALLDRAVADGFLRPETRSSIVIAPGIGSVLEAMAHQRSSRPVVGVEVDVEL